MANLLCEHWALFSETWPASGMMQNGKVYGLPMQVRPIIVSESSSLPTPTTQDNSGRCRDHGGDLLHELVCGCPRSERKQNGLMPTPTVFHTTMHDEPIEYFLEREARSSTGQIGKSLGVALRMEMMPTPTTRDFKDGTAEHERNGVI